MAYNSKGTKNQVATRYQGGGLRSFLENSSHRLVPQSFGQQTHSLLLYRWKRFERAGLAWG